MLNKRYNKHDDCWLEILGHYSEYEKIPWNILRIRNNEFMYTTGAEGMIIEAVKYKKTTYSVTSSEQKI